MKLAILCPVAAILVLPAGMALSQGRGDTGNPKQVTEETKQISGQIVGVKSTACVSMRGTITEGGHRWNVVAANGCGKVLRCTVNMTLKTSHGYTTNASCTPGVPTGTTTVCSAYDSTLKWTTVVGGNFSCS